MNVLVDTCVWSAALRRRSPGPLERGLVTEMAELIGEKRVVVIGAVRQEVLCGIRNADQFAAVRDRLRSFPDLALDERDHEEAASLFNACRRRGIQGSNTDFLICAVAMGHGLSVFTTDSDFLVYRRVLGVVLHEPR